MFACGLTLNFLNFHIWTWTSCTDLAFWSPVLILVLELLILLLSCLLSQNSIYFLNTRFFVWVLLTVSKLTTGISSQLRLFWLLFLRLRYTIFIIWILVNRLVLLLVLVILIISVIYCVDYSLLILSLIHINSVTTVSSSATGSTLREWSLPWVGLSSCILFAIWQILYFTTVLVLHDSMYKYSINFLYYI